MRCSKCGTEGILGKKFCAECGSPLSNRCSNCNSENAPGSKFCADCGRELGKDVGVDDGKPFAAGADGGVRIAPERQTSEAVDGERKTVTALFADIKGSTELMRDLDPEEARAIVDPALKLMIDATHRYDDLRRAIGVGRADDGQAQAAKVMRINPGFTLEYQKQHSVVIKGADSGPQLCLHGPGGPEVRN